MSERITTAILPVEAHPQITSETFTDYLLRGELALDSELPNQLDLGRFSQTFASLYENSQQTHVWDMKTRKEMLRETRKVKHKEFRQSLEEKANEQAAAERHSIIFYDPEDSSIKETDIVHGEYTTVNTGETIYRLLKDNKIPIINIHTHPDDSLFSQVDYRGLIVKPATDVGRVIKAEVVLCQNLQIFAIPTKLTPNFSGFKSGRVINQSAKLMNNEVESSLSKLKALARRLTKKRDKTLKDTLKEIKKRFKPKKTDTPEEFTSMVMEEMGDEIQKGEKIQARLLKVFQKMEKTTKKIENAAAIEFARNNNIKLYMSTDMRIFKAFSA